VHQHPSTRRDACLTRSLVLLRTAAAFGQGGGAEPLPRVVEAIADPTGVSGSKRSLEEILRDAAQDFEAFYQERAAAPANGSILVAAVDGKGIPMVKPGGAQPTVRLTKGQKANRKRMATVAAVFTHAPWVCGADLLYSWNCYILMTDCINFFGNVQPSFWRQSPAVPRCRLEGIVAIVVED